MSKKRYFWQRKKEEPEQQEMRAKSLGALAFSSGTTYREDRAMSLSAVYRAANLISDSIAQLPVQLFKQDKDGFLQRDFNDPMVYVLDQCPNKRMTRFQFMKCLIQSVLLRGDGFAYIERNEHGNVVGLHYIPHEYVTVIEPMYLNDAPTYSISSMAQTFKSEDMIHIFQNTDDGITGKSVLYNARKTLELAWDELEHASTFFESGCNAFGLLKSNGPMTKEQKAALKKDWLEARNGGGALKGCVVLDDSFQYQSISFSAAEAQLIESRAFSISDIGRFFGLSNVKMFVEGATSYNSLEQEQLGFLATLQPIICKIEQEFQRKIFPGQNVRIKFDTTELIRTDSAALAGYISKLISWGIISPNEGRRMLNMAPVEGGDSTFMPVNVMTLENALKNKPADNKITTENIDVEDKKSDEEDDKEKEEK